MLIIGKDLCPKCGEVLKLTQDKKTCASVCKTCGTDLFILNMKRLDKEHDKAVHNAIVNISGLIDGPNVVNIPKLLSKNSRLQSENASLQSENKILREIIELRNKESENILAIIKNMKAELARCGIV